MTTEELYELQEDEILGCVCVYKKGDNGMWSQTETKQIILKILNILRKTEKSKVS